MDQSINIKKLGVIPCGKINHFAQPVNLNPRGWTTPLTGSRLNWLDQKNVIKGHGNSKDKNCCSYYLNFKIPVYKLTKMNVYTNE